MIEGLSLLGKHVMGVFFFLVWKSIWIALPKSRDCGCALAYFGSTMTFEVPTCTFVGWEYRSVRQRAGHDYFLPLFFSFFFLR